MFQLFAFTLTPSLINFPLQIHNILINWTFIGLMSFIRFGHAIDECSRLRVCTVVWGCVRDDEPSAT